MRVLLKQHGRILDTFPTAHNAKALTPAMTAKAKESMTDLVAKKRAETGYYQVCLVRSLAAYDLSDVGMVDTANEIA